MINPQKAVQWYRNTYGDNTLSDYDIYEYLKTKYPQYDYAQNPFQGIREEETPKYEEQDQSIWSKLLTYNIADNYAEDSKWAQQAYNKSTAGTIYEIMHGKKKYEDAGEAEGWWDEVGQFFVGLASPVDIVSFFGSGAIGSMAAKKIGQSSLKKWALKGSEAMMKKQAAKKGISQQFHKYLRRQAGLESGLSLGMLGATHGTLHETAKQSSEINEGKRDKFDPWAISWAAAKHGASNIALGSVAGYYTKGIMAPKFAQAQAKTSKDFSNVATRMTMNPVGQVAAEASIFTTGQVLEQAVTGQPVSVDDFLSGFFMNTGIVGGMRLATKPLRIGQGDLARYQKAKKTFYGELYEPINFKKKVEKVKTEYQKNKESLENVSEDLISQGISSKEVVERIAKLDLEKTSTKDALVEFNKIVEDYNSTLKLLNTKKGSELPKEIQSKLIKDIGAIQSIFHSIYSDMKNNKELAYEAFKDLIKKPEDKKLVDAMIETKLKGIEKSHEIMNLLMNGDKDAIKKVRESYGESFEYKVTEKDGKFQVSFEAPDGTPLKLPDYMKNFTSKEAANKAGKSLIKSTKEVIAKEESIVSQAEQRPYVAVSAEGALLVDASGKRIISYAPKAQVEKMIAEGKAIDPSINPSNVNQSNQNLNSNILENVVEKAVKPLREQIDIITPATEGMPMSKPSFEAKLANSKKVLDKNTPIGTLTKEENIFSTRYIRGKDADRKKVVRESLEKMNEIEKVAFVDFATDYISKNKAGSSAVINEVAKFMVHLKESNTDITKIKMQDIASYFDRYEKNLPSTTAANAMAQLSDFLLKNDYVKGNVGIELRQFAKSKFTEYNEYVSEGKNPAKEGVRKKTIEEATKTQNEGVEIVAKLGGRFYLRDREINKLAKFTKNEESLNKVLKFDKETGEYYLDLPQNVIAKSFSRFVYIDKELANQITRYVAEGKSLKDIHVTKVSQLIKNKIKDSGGKSITNNPNSPFVDLRRRGKSVGKLTYEEASIQDYMFGHNKNRIDAIYKKLTPSEYIKQQKELHKKIGSPIPSETQKEFYRTKVKGDTSKEIHYNHKKALGEKYPELVIDLVKEFKDKSIPKDAVGYLENLEKWTVKVKMGKAPSDTIPHEVAHYVFKVMNALDKHYKMRELPKQSQKTMKLIKEAEKIFVDKDGKFNEESAVVMIGKAIDGQLQKPMLAKAKSFFKRLNVFFKQIFNKPLTREEIAYMLGTKIVQRKGIPIMNKVTGGREYLKAMELPTQKFLNVVSRDIRNTAKEMGIKDKKLIEFIADEIGIESPTKFKISLPKDELSDAYINKKEQIVDFYNAFQTFNLDKFVTKKNLIGRLRLIRRIDSHDVNEPYSRINKGITTEVQKKLLTNVFGVKEGNLYLATHDQLKSYSDYLYQLKAKKRENTDWVTTSDANEFMNLDIAKGTTRAIQEGLFMFGEMGDAIKAAGFKKLGKMMNEHYAIEQGNQAPLVFYERNAMKILGGNPLTQNARLNKINDYIWTLDNRGEQFLAQEKFMNRNIPDKAHFKASIKFFKKAIKKEWFDTVKEDKNGFKRGADLKKYVNMDTKEGKIANEYFKMSEEFGDKKLKKSLLLRAANEAEYQDIVANSDVKFLGTHIARNFTDHGKLSLRVGKSRDIAMKSMIEEIALAEAYKKYGKEKVQKDLSLVENMIERAEGLAAIKFDDMLRFNPSKLSIKHLKRRHSLQKLYSRDDKGKLQRVYEHKWDRTIKPYIWGMSKFYATLEVFPEMVNFEGFKKPGIKKQLALLEQGEGRTRVVGRWVKDGFLRQLGMDNNANPYDITFTHMETAARTLAKTGLSFPTSGAKNLLTGQTQTLYAQKAYDWAKGMLDVFTGDAKKYNEALATNAFGVGNKIYEAKTTGQISKVANMLSELAFTFGFMKPTEKFNRLASIFAAKYDINRQIQTLKNYKVGSKEYKKAETRLKWYEVEGKDLKLLSKYGSREGVEGYLTGFEKFKAQRQLDNIHQRMNTAAHVKTQGSSADLFMPKWAGTRGMKPLTLFKRMAFAATSNTIKNTKQAKKDGNWFKPVIGLTATYISGQTMIGLYSKILGTEMPDENSDWFQRFKTIMWKGEVGGILSDFVSPFDNHDSLNPAIWNSMGSIIVALNQLKDDKITKNQAFDMILKKNLSGYNNTMKIFERTMNPLNRDRIRFGKLYRQFEEDVFEDPNITGESTRRTKYFKDLQSVFYGGNAEDFSKQLALTFVAIAHDYYRLNKADTIDEAFKMANTQIEKKLKNLNPNKATFSKVGKKSKRTSAKFIKWLQKHKESDILIPRLFEIEAEYKKRLQDYLSQVPKYWRKHSVANLLNDFDWKQQDF